MDTITDYRNEHNHMQIPTNPMLPFVPLLFLLLQIACGMEYEEPTPGRVFKRLHGSWIVAEYQIDVRGTEPSSEPVYYQINATMSPSQKQLSLSEVDVVSGKVLKHLADITETGYSVLSSSMTLVLPGMNKTVPFRVTFPDKQTTVDAS